MVASVKVFRDNKITLIPIPEWFEINYKELPNESKRYFQVIERIFEIQGVNDYQKIYDFLRVDFNYHRTLIKYEELKGMQLPFEQDILRFIAFLFGTNYFGLIGFTTLETWLNAKDINHPNKEVEFDYSLLEASGYNYGQNAIRQKLLSTLPWVSEQGGS